MTEIWDLLGHKQICPTVTIEWLEPTVGLIRFLYPGPGDYPYRGVVSVDVDGTEYEFKGMVFHAKNDAPTFAEHRAIKRYLADMGLIGISRRLKNGNVVVKQYGNPAQSNCGEMKMATRTFVVNWKLINDETGKQEAAGSLESNGRALAEVRHMQNLLKSGYQEPVEAIGDELAAAQAAA